MAITTAIRPPGNPYPGARPFAAGEDARLAGRATVAREIAASWSRNRITVLAGASGAGKTSLMQAGVLPLVSGANRDVLPPGRVTGRPVFPSAALFDHNRFVLALLTAWAANEQPTRLSRMSISGFLAQRRRQVAASQTLVAIDQAEDLFSSAGDSERDWFIGQLTDAIEQQPALRVLIAVRDEALRDLLADRRLQSATVIRIGALSRDAAVEAVVKPAADAGRRFSQAAAEALVDKLLDDPASHASGVVSVTGQTVQPVLLQLTCSALWDALPASVTLVTVAEVQNLLDVDECLAGYVFSAVTTVAHRDNISRSRLFGLMVRDLADGDAARAVSDAGAASSWARALRRLEGLHVLESELRGPNRWFALLSNHLVAPLKLAAEPSYGALLARRNDQPARRLLTDWLGQAADALEDDELVVAERLVREVTSAAAASDFRLRAQALTLMGNIAIKRGSLSRARKLYFSAAEFYEAAQDRSEVGRLLAAIGRLHLDEWDPGAAVSVLHSAASRLPSDAAVMLDLARAFASSGEPVAAVATLRTVRAADAEVGAEEARLMRADLLADLGDAAGALRELGSATHQEPLAARAVRAFSLARLGKLADADEGIGQALQVGGENGPVLLRAAQIRALRGDAAGADRYLSQAVAATMPRLNQYQHRQADSLREECGV